jgi:hypothetical protein
MNFRVLFAAIVAATLATPAFATESPDKTEVHPPAVITDASGNVWGYDAPTQQSTKNGVIVGASHVAYDQLYYSHTFYHNLSATGANWWYWNGTGFTQAAGGGADPRTSCTQSANGATVTSTSGSICDASGNTWTLTTGTGLQVTKNGTKQGTADVVLMYYDNPNDRIYQENSDMDWWYTAANGTVSWVATVDPRTSANCTSTSWCDDFNGTALNADQHMNTADRWGYTDPDSLYWDGYNVNQAWMVNPLHTGTTGTSFTNLYKMDGSGDLVLGIDNTPGTCTTACGNLSWISGQLVSTTAFTPGHYIEARAKMTATPGTNFAIWLYDDHRSTGGIYQEIDLVEAVRANDNSWVNGSQAIHHDYITPTEANEPWYHYGTDTPAYDPTVWHTYGVDWEPGSICLYIDRMQSGCSAYGGSNYTGSMHLWLSSQGAASGWGGNLQTGVTMPASMTIDYVRSYDHKPF